MNRTRLLLLVLIASFALNLFFIGGIAYRMNSGAPVSGRPLPPNVNWMVRDLSEARRMELQPLMEHSAEEIRPVRRELFEAQSVVNQLMASADYDAAALEAAFAELRAANARYQLMSHQHSVAMLNELTEAERRVAVEFINRRGPQDGRDPLGRDRNNNQPRDFRPGPPGDGRAPLPRDIQ